MREKNPPSPKDYARCAEKGGQLWVLHAIIRDEGPREKDSVNLENPLRRNAEDHWGGILIRATSFTGEYGVYNWEGEEVKRWVSQKMASGGNVSRNNSGQSSP